MCRPARARRVAASLERQRGRDVPAPADDVVAVHRRADDRAVPVDADDPDRAPLRRLRAECQEPAVRRKGRADVPNSAVASSGDEPRLAPGSGQVDVAAAQVRHVRAAAASGSLALGRRGRVRDPPLVSAFGRRLRGGRLGVARHGPFAATAITAVTASAPATRPARCIRRRSGEVRFASRSMRRPLQCALATSSQPARTARFLPAKERDTLRLRARSRADRVLPSRAPGGSRRRALSPPRRRQAACRPGPAVAPS